MERIRIDPEHVQKLARDRGASCDKCEFGLVEKPAHLGSHSLWLQRMIQAKNGLIEFCDCEAGQRYRNYLRRMWKESQKDGYYSLPVMDRRTGQQLRDLRGKPVTQIEALEERVVQESVEAPRKRFWVDESRHAGGHHHDNDYPVPPGEGTYAEQAEY